MKRLLQTIIMAVSLLLQACSGISPIAGAGVEVASSPSATVTMPVTMPQLTPRATLPAQADLFIDELAKDTWTYLHSDWATENHLPWSWRSTTLGGGDYANTAEIGLYALSWLAVYDLAYPWSPTWPETESEITAILDQLRTWQTGAQSQQPHGPNAYKTSVFYQWYWISWDPPVVGGGAGDHIVPSIDNAWLAASLITIREYAKAHQHPVIAQKADAILADMDFTLWYDTNTHRFFWGDVENPLGGVQADYYSNENRIINFVARALSHLSADEFRQSLVSLEQPSGVYSAISVEKVAWDGSYFTYATPTLFIREMETSYGNNTVLAAAQAQRAYAQEQNYVAWGLSDCYDSGDGGYIQQGAPPAAMTGSLETSPGLVTPHASVLALITPLASQVITNLFTISDTFSCAYNPTYGFNDSVMTNPIASTYGQCSNRFSALAQLWIFLTVTNYKNGFIWNYFYRDPGVRDAHTEMFEGKEVYLPVIMN